MIGFSKNVRNDVAAEDAVITKVLKHHGAIAYVKTNTPQAMLRFVGVLFFFFFFFEIPLISVIIRG